MAPREDQRHQTRDMMGLARRAFAWALVSAAMTLISIVTEPAVAVAVEVGQPAPDFKLPSTTGGDVALSDFRGKKWVLLEFYGADFAPT
jgi:hypothetical protein